MTPAASNLDPNSNPTLYVNAVLAIYVDMPDTPLRASVADQRQARSWFDRGVPLPLVETALLLALLRRTARLSEMCDCPASVPSPTSNPSLRNFWSIQFQAVISNTCALNYAVSPGAPLRRAFKKLRFLVIANSPDNPDRSLGVCSHPWFPGLRPRSCPPLHVLPMRLKRQRMLFHSRRVSAMTKARRRHGPKIRYDNYR